MHRPMARAADGVLHPVALAALIVLVVNDQVLKAVSPGVVTGKVSDVAGLIVAPLVLQAGWEVGQWMAGRWTGPSARVLAIAIVGTGVAFAAVQIWPPATDLYRGALGLAQWPLRLLASLVTSTPGPSPVPVQAVADAADLLALPALAVTWWVGRRRVRPG
jgi:hypothetical protein